jgi:hypothetical protein
MSPRRGSKPRRTDRLVVGRNMTLTLSQTVINIWSWAPDGARNQDALTDWSSVVMWLWLWETSRFDIPAIPFGWSCVLAKNSQHLLRVCNILIIVFYFKEFSLTPTKGEFQAQLMDRYICEPYVVRFCTLQNIFTCVIYRFLLGSDLLPVCWRTHSR